MAKVLLLCNVEVHREPGRVVEVEVKLHHHMHGQQSQGGLPDNQVPAKSASGPLVCNNTNTNNNVTIDCLNYI